MVLDTITAFNPPLLPAPSPLLALPFTLLLCCWMTAPPAFASCPSLCFSSWQYKLLQQPHNFDLQSFCSISLWQCTNQTLAFILDRADYWCTDLRVTSELRSLCGARCTKMWIKTLKPEQNIPFKKTSNLSIPVFFLSVAI